VGRVFHPRQIPGLRLLHDGYGTHNLFQDSARTQPVTAFEQFAGSITDSSGLGNHATQASAPSRPRYSARYNILVGTETLSTQSVATFAASYTLRHDGPGTVTLSGTATGAYAAGTHSIACTAGTMTLTVSGIVARADLRVTGDGIGMPAYQRVSTSIDYDTAGFLPYLSFDGVDDSLSTAQINFTNTDKMVVLAAITSNPAATSIGIVLELGLSLPVGGMTLHDSFTTGNTSVGIRQSSSSVYGFPRVTGKPNIITSIIDYGALAATDEIKIRRNGVSMTLSDQGGQNGPAGSGSFANEQLFIGRRAGAFLPASIRLHFVAIYDRILTPAEITKLEAYANKKTGAY
jgi:hypothetical protein